MAGDSGPRKEPSDPRGAEDQAGAAEGPPVLYRRRPELLAEMVAQVGAAGHPDALGDGLDQERSRLEYALSGDHAGGSTSAMCQAYLGA